MKSFKVLVCGGRDYNDYRHVRKVLNRLHEAVRLSGKVLVIIHGNARGADLLADTYARDEQIEVLSFPANWDLYGKRAGFIRNKQMLDVGKPDLIIAFPGGRGTDMMCEIAEKAGVPVRRYK